VDHRYLLFLRLGEGEKAARFTLHGIL